MVVDPHAVEAGVFATGNKVRSLLHRKTNRNADVHLYRHMSSPSSG